MPRGVKKENLPTKICVTCGRPFNWRKKWERCWDEVTTCSKGCNHRRRETNQKEARNEKKSTTTTTRSLSSVVGDGGGDYSAIAPSIEQQQDDSGVSTEPVLDHPQRPDSDTMKQLLLLNNSNNNGDDDDGDDDSDDNELETSSEIMDPEARKKAIRKAAKKEKKAARRAQREGRGDPTAGQKECDMCDKSVNLLVRCMYKQGQADWEMVCGKCWNRASGGVVDGDAAHPHYRYGGLWKNRRAQP